MRDDCSPSDPLFFDWAKGRPVPEIAAELAEYSDMVRSHVARGVRFLRARIVSEPVTDYVRFLYEITEAVNISAGEDVRWLPRRYASDLCLPGNDFWAFDDREVRFGHFSGDGLIMGHELRADPATVRLCTSAFDAVWARAVPHRDYRPV